MNTPTALVRLRAHFRDLEGDAEEWLPDVKVLVLGNGRIGKTQICRRLRGEEYDPTIESTHGIEIHPARLAMQGAGESLVPEAILHLWDFGGQDLYHGAHGLFLRTRAVILAVWTPGKETEATDEHGGITFRNHRLPYWIETVRYVGGADRPLVLVQNQCERAQDEQRRPPVDDAVLKPFPLCKEVHYSAKSNRGRATLEDALRQAVEHEWNRRGPDRIGRGRLAVRRRIEAIQQATDASTQRTMDRAEFDEICQQEGGVSSTEALLEYLDAADVVIYRHGLFGGRIILDHAWAMAAVYAVFDRRGCYQHLRESRGRFRPSTLDRLVWRAYEPDEQSLFLDLMTACGVCFVHRRGDEARGIEAEYIAPDLLPGPEDLEAELAERWEPFEPGDTLTVRLPFLPPGLMRQLISQVGAEAGLNALYWKDGVYFYDREARSRVRIDQHQDEAPGRWSGRLVVEARGGAAPELLARLRGWLEPLLSDEAGEGWTIEGPLRMAKASVVASAVLEARGSLVEPRPAALGDDPVVIVRPPRPAPGPEPLARKKYGISYAWEDPSRDVVDRVCRRAQERGIDVLRDTTRLGAGDSFARFVAELAEDDRRLFVILSDRYLKSEYCMQELLEVWRRCGRDPDRFADRIRAHRVDDAKVLARIERATYYEHWRSLEAEYARRLDSRLQAAATAEIDDFRFYKTVATNLPEMLSLICDRIFPRDFREFEAYGFDDPPEGHAQAH